LPAPYFVLAVVLTGVLGTGVGVDPLRGGVKTRPPPALEATTTPVPTGAEVTVLNGTEAVGLELTVPPPSKVCPSSGWC